MSATRGSIQRCRLASAMFAAFLLQACSGEQAPSSTTTAAPSADLTALAAQLAELETRATRLKDVQDIKRLQRSFGYYMEEALWDQVVELFSDNATFEFGRDGVYRGKARISAWLHALGGGQQGLREGQLQEYLQLMPVITLDESGTRARARWRAIMLLGEYGAEALWGEGPYENEYVKEDGVWKISKLQWFQTILVPYEGGWGRHEDVNKGIWVSPQLPPDAPPSHDYGYWPTTFLPPFSFTNPVGKYVPASSAEGVRP